MDINFTPADRIFLYALFKAHAATVARYSISNISDRDLPDPGEFFDQVMANDLEEEGDELNSFRQTTPNKTAGS